MATTTATVTFRTTVTARARTTVMASALATSIAAANVRQTSDLNLPLLLHLKEGEGRDG